MALSKIWAAFIIAAVLMAGIRFTFNGDKDVFSRMVTGSSSDPYTTTYYDISYDNGKSALPSIADFEKRIQGYGYVPADSTHPATVLIAAPGNATANTYTATHPGIKIKSHDAISRTLYKHNDGIIETCKVAVNICIGLIGIMALFMGLMGIAERAGGINLLSRIIGPFFTKLFPEVPKGHPAFGHMMMNFSANLLGLDNAATPFGLKAMESLQELNPDKNRASNAQIMFLCLHASGLTLIPVSIIAIRSSMGATNPTDIFIPCMIATFAATVAAMSMVSIKQKINLFQPVILAWIGGLSAIVAALVVYVTSLNMDGVQSFSGILSNGLILLIFLVIVLGALYKKIDIFDAFVSGAKGGFETSVRIIPYLVGMLVAISLLRTSGTFDIIIDGMKSIFIATGMDTHFVDALPTALIRPLSGSGARGMMVDTMNTFGADSFAGRLSGIMQGASDTTFYVIAVYFGAVAVKNTRYTIGFMLLADLVGIITSIILAYVFFGGTI